MRQLVEEVEDVLEAVEAELLATEAEQRELVSEQEAAAVAGILAETAATSLETFAVVAAWRTVVARLAVVGTVVASERLAVDVVARAALACPDLEEDPS